MKQILFVLAALVIIVSCKKEEPSFCYMCSQKVTYRVKDNVPTHSAITSKEYCGMTYQDIVTLEKETPGSSTADYTTYQLECVREE